MNTIYIAKREFDSFFLSPIAYVVAFLFLLLTGVLFNLNFQQGAPAEMRTLFVALTFVLIPVGPAISMRLLAEELKSGTLETLMTSPVTDIEVVVGKWLGGLGFLIALLIPTLIYVLILEVHGNPEYGPILTGYLGVICVGAMYVAIGLFASSLTRNQIIAFISAMFIILLFAVIAHVAPPYLPTNWQQLIWYISVPQRLIDFSKGILDFKDFVYFISGTALFLTFAVKALETRRWR